MAVQPQIPPSVERALRQLEKRLEIVERSAQKSGAANPDTAGATLPQLETEVNEIKALLRAVGHMAP